MIFALLLICARAGQDDDLYREAKRAEERGSYEEALAFCSALLASNRESPRAQDCLRRSGALQRRRDLDGSFRAWGELQEVRRQFRERSPEERSLRVASIADAETTSQAVRAEATAWLAREALQAGDGQSALARLEALALPDEEPELSVQLLQLRARALAVLGRAEEAMAMQSQIQIPTAPGGERPTPVDRALIARRWRTLATAAFGWLISFTALAALVAARGLWTRDWQPRTLIPWGLLPIFVSTVGAYALAEGWERGAGRALPYMGVGFALVHLLSLAALAALAKRPLLAGIVRVAALFATLSVAMIALWSTGTIGWLYRW